MKKSNLFLVLLTALIVMSCSKDETTMSIPQESNAIEFGTYVGRDAQTRASVINTDAQLQAKGFGVFAYYTNDDDYSTDSKPNFMYNQEVKFADSKWGYSPVKYWPNEVTGNSGFDKDKLSFFAYAPYSAASTTLAPNNFAFTPANNVAGDPTITYTVNETAILQEDLLWGVNAVVGAGNGLPFLNQQKQTTTGNINFQFKHALARIGFNVEALVDQVNGNGTGATDNEVTTGTIPAATKIVVTKVDLIGKFYQSGVLNLNNSGAATPNWGAYLPVTLVDRTFSLTPTDNFETVADHGEATFTTKGQLVTSTTAKQKLNKDDSYLMVIPQNFIAGKEIKIIVTYDVITKDIALETGQSKVTNVITSSPFIFDFVGGKAYTFNLHLGMTSVKFDATVSEWDVVTPGTVVNVPINN